MQDDGRARKRQNPEEVEPASGFYGGHKACREGGQGVCRPCRLEAMIAPVCASANIFSKKSVAGHASDGFANPFRWRYL